MKLNMLSNVLGSKKARKRVGRGIGSGTGKTCGRGVKGQKSRSGVSIKTEGGQMPLIKRLPKRGFNSSKSIDYIVIDILTINSLVSAKRLNIEENITKSSLLKLGLIKNIKKSVKLLCSSSIKLDHKVTIDFDAYSKKARSAVESAGGIVL